MSRLLKSAWGSPSVRRDGVSTIYSYKDPSQPFRQLDVAISTVPFPNLRAAPPIEGQNLTADGFVPTKRSQSFRTAQIAGQIVKWYQQSDAGGADGAFFKTNGFQNRGADGVVRYYELTAEAGPNAVDEVQRWFESLK